MRPTIQLHTRSGRQEVTLEALHLADRRIFLKEVARAASYDHYMSADEAIQFGLCDEIIERRGGAEVPPLCSEADDAAIVA